MQCRIIGNSMFALLLIVILTASWKSWSFKLVSRRNPVKSNLFASSQVLTYYFVLTVLFTYFLSLKRG